MTGATPAVRAAVAALPPLRDTIAQAGLAARKALGQNFLLDLNLTARIVRAAGDLAGATAVEIGPGPGGLTRMLVLSDADRVVAIEADDRAVTALAPLVAASGGRLAVHHGDALATDVTALGPPPVALVANLPYNIATPLLLGWLRHAERLRSLTLMFQKEVADRIVAAPGTKAYGRLSVISQWRCRAEIAFNLPARAFTPPPKVDSTVVVLTPRAAPEPAPFTALERVTQAAFGQRRKMLRASLKTLCPDPEALLAHAAIDPQRRAETLTIAEFAALARAL